MRSHLSRYGALAITYAGGRSILFLALLIPSLAGAQSAALGRLELLLVAGSLGASLGPLGIDNALMHRDFSSRRHVWKLGMWLAGIFGFILSVLVALPLGASAMPIAGALGASLALGRIAQGHLRVQDHMSPMLLGTFILLVGYAALYMTLGTIGMKVTIASASALATATVLSVAPSWYVQRAQPAGSEVRTKEIILFGLPLTIANMTAWLVAASDRYMLKWIVGVEVVGTYGLVVRTIMLYSGICSTVVLWWQVESLRRGKQWTLNNAGKFLTLSTMGVFVGALLLWKPLTLILPSLLPTTVSELDPLVSWRLFAVVAWVAGSLCLAPLVVARHVRMVALIWTTNAAVNILLNLYLIPRWEMTGAAAATALSNTVAASLALWVLKRTF